MGNKLLLLSASSALILSFLLLRPMDNPWWPLGKSHAADLLVWNASIFTCDSSLPFSEAMAVRRGKIIAVGNYSSLTEIDTCNNKSSPCFRDLVHEVKKSNDQLLSLRGIMIANHNRLSIKEKREIGLWERETARRRPHHCCHLLAIDGAFVGSSTRQLNLHGKVVHPGFIDSHLHFINGGLQMSRVDLSEARSMDNFVEKVKDAVKEKHEGDWLLGGGWNNDLWGGDLPASHWIDEITPHNPVWLTRKDGHMGLANSLALRIAGIINSTENPIGGTVVKNNHGAPTGLLIDGAMKFILPVIPNVSLHERRKAFTRASGYAVKRGVTTVVDFGRFFPGTSVDSVWQDLSEIYQWADSSDKMVIRVCLFFPMQTWSRLAKLIQKKGRRISQWIYLGGVKAFADGSLGSNSALFHEPYVDEPHNCGLEVIDFDTLRNLTLESDKSGLQVAIHAIGDKANDRVLELAEMVENENGIRDRRSRIEHAQHLAPGSPPRFAQLKVLASVQPEQLLDDADVAEKKLGIERSLKGSYLFQSLLSSGAQLAFGSDWPVVDMNPLRGITAATQRIPSGWQHPWIPSERVSVEDALKAYTISAAFGSFMDADLGSLSPGKLADFVVLSSSSWEEFVGATPPSSVAATYVGGVQVFP